MAKQVESETKKQKKSTSIEISMVEQTEFDDKVLEQCLRRGEIKASEKMEQPPQVLWVGECVIATFGNFSATTGKAKTKKTFNLSAMVAAAATNSTILNYRATFPDDKRTILYFDTEQSKFHCHNVIERIYKLAGLKLEKDDKRIKFYGLREYTPSLRKAVVDYALRKFKNVGLVVIDGIRDLMYDINNAKEATDVMTMLMAWTSTYNLHVHCVLHLNKNDNNTRGHIGTEMENKAETVLIISKNRQDSNISEVKPMHMRDKEFETFAFHIDDNALPVLDPYHVTVVKPKEKPLVELDDDIHMNVLQHLFEDHKPEKYGEMIDFIIDAYAAEGYKQGRNAAKNLQKALAEKKIITKEDDGYHYHPELFSEDEQV